MDADPKDSFVPPSLDAEGIAAQLHDAALDLDRICYDEDAEELALVLWQEDTLREAVNVTRFMFLRERVRYWRREVILRLREVKSWRLVGDRRVRYPILFDVVFDKQKGVLLFDTGGLADLLVLVPAVQASLEYSGRQSCEDFGVSTIRRRRVRGTRESKRERM